MAHYSDAQVVHPRFVLFNWTSTATVALLCAFLINFLFASGHDAQRCVELIALSVTVISALICIARGQVPVVLNNVPPVLLLFLTLGTISAAMAYSLRHAVFEWSILLLLLAVVFVIAAELTHHAERVSSVIKWIGIACGLYSLRVLIMYGSALASGLQPNWSVITVGFSNVRHLSHTQTPLLPLIVLLVLTAPKEGMWRKTWFALASFWWALLFVTEARASLLALMLACAIVLVLRRAHARQFLVTMALTALAGVVLYTLLFILLPVLVGLMPISSPISVLTRTASNPSSNRNILWTFALELIKAHPWFGVGPQHFAHAATSLNTGAHPHNWMLQIAAEWGIPAFLCLFGAVFVGARGLIRSGTRIADADLANQQMLVTLQVACAAIFVDGFFSGVIVMPQSQLAIALVLGIACAWVRLQKSTEPQATSAPSGTKRVVMATVVAAGLCGLIWSVAPDFMRHMRGEPLTPTEAAASPIMYWPRMWEAGYF